MKRFALALTAIVMSLAVLISAPACALADEPSPSGTSTDDAKDATAPHADPLRVLMDWALRELGAHVAEGRADTGLAEWFEGGADVPLSSLRDALKAAGWNGPKLEQWLAHSALDAAAQLGAWLGPAMRGHGAHAHGPHAQGPHARPWRQGPWSSHAWRSGPGNSRGRHAQPWGAGRWSRERGPDARRALGWGAWPSWGPWRPEMQGAEAEPHAREPREKRADRRAARERGAAWERRGPAWRQGGARPGPMWPRGADHQPMPGAHEFQQGARKWLDAWMRGRDGQQRGPDSDAPKWMEAWLKAAMGEDEDGAATNTPVRVRILRIQDQPTKDADATGEKGSKKTAPAPAAPK